MLFSLTAAAFRIVISVTTEIKEPYAFDADHGALRAALGRDGRALGRQPLGGTDPRAALPLSEASHRRGDRRHADPCALQCQHVLARIAGLGAGDAYPCAGRPARPFRGEAGPLGHAADYRRGTEAPRGRPDPHHAAPMR